MSSVSPLRIALIALLVISTALFAIGVASERSDGADTHAAAESAAAEESHAEQEGGEQAQGEAAAHTKAGEEPGSKDEAGAHAEAGEDERLLGIDLESTPLIVAAVLAGLALAVAAATDVGRRGWFLLALAGIALAWAALDIREAAHQIDESSDGLAVIAGTVAALHLAAAAVAGKLRSTPA